MLMEMMSEKWLSSGGWVPMPSAPPRLTDDRGRAVRILSWSLTYRLPKAENAYVTVKAEMPEPQAPDQRHEIRTEITRSDPLFGELAKGRPPLPKKTIDSSHAERIARAAGALTGPGPGFSLHMAMVDGEFAPIWLLPYVYPDGSHRAIRADSGKFVYLVMGSASDRSWLKDPKWTAKKP
jgi:hypothetical protein